MEASNIIPWIVIAIAALIAQSSSKARKMRQKETKNPSTPEYGEAWPKWDSPQPAAPHPTFPKPTAPRPATPRPAAPFDIPAPKQRAEAGDDEFGGSVFGPVLRKTKAARQHLRTTADSAAPARERADRQPLSPATAAQPVKQPAATPPANDEKSGIVEEFDLRRAIIYSEILKPKFDE